MNNDRGARSLAGKENGNISTVTWVYLSPIGSRKEIEIVV
jgi:hypothetical protein